MTTNVKEKILLTKEQETLLIPLYAKATESRRPGAIFVDEKAQEILERVDYDFARLRIPRKTVLSLCIRAARLDVYTRQFLAGHPQGVVVHLGCGLDSRCLRARPDNAMAAGATTGAAEWYDLDLPPVIELRRKFYQETPSYHMIPSSVSDLGWVDGVPAQGRPVLVIAEGLLMYLNEPEVKALLLKLSEAFPGCHLACDVFSVLTARKAKDISSLEKTGATVQWGIDDAHAIETWAPGTPGAPGICLEEEWYFAEAPEIARLGGAYRLAFRLAGRFKAANMAHRILYLAL